MYLLEPDLLQVFFFFSPICVFWVETKTLFYYVNIICGEYLSQISIADHAAGSRNSPSP